MLPLSDNALDEIVARERSLGKPPLTDWDSLADRLRAEGLMRESIFSRVSSSPMLRVAAGLVLAVGGAAVGRASAGAPLLPAKTASTVAAIDATPGAAAPSASFASGGPISFSSPEHAWEILNRAGEEYQQASEYLSANNNEIPMPPSTDQYRTRLAALDNVMSEMRDALKQAPQDPVINQYYLATVGAREATLRQLGTVLPASARMNRF